MLDTKDTLIDNEYVRMWYYPKPGIIHHQFLQPVSSEAFQNTLISGLRVLQKYGAQKWLSDDRLNSILSAEDNSWSHNFWLPRAYKAGWRYWAVLPPNKARGHVNMKRITEEVGHLPRIEIGIFSDPDEALQWLVEQGTNDNK